MPYWHHACLISEIGAEDHRQDDRIITGGFAESFRGDALQAGLRRGCSGLGFTRVESFLQQRIKRGSREAVTGEFQKCPCQGFASGGLQVRVLAATLLLLANGPQETVGDIAFGARPNNAVVAGIAAELLLEIGNAALQAFKHISRFTTDVFKLAIRHLRQIGHKHLAVIWKGQIGRTRTTAVVTLSSEALRAIRGNRTSGTTATG